MQTVAVDARQTSPGEPLILMTCHGTILCRTTQGIIHVPLGGVTDAVTVVRVGGHALAREDRFEDMLCNSRDAKVLTGSAELPDGVELVVDPAIRTATLRRRDQYFAAIPDEPRLIDDRMAAGSWETFLLLSENDLAVILRLFSKNWLVRSSLEIVRGHQIRLNQSWQLVFPEFLLDLRYNTPFQMADGGKSLCILKNGWQIEYLLEYAPFIFFTAFRAPSVLAQACMAIQSFLEFGNYTGHIHVITDQDANFFLDAVPRLRPDQLTVQNVPVTDWVGFVGAKYAILDFAAAYDHQPLLFLDPDVVCDTTIEPLLATILSLERMSAPLEDTTFLRVNPSVGASLIQRAGLSPRFACGFNAGTLGIPNLARCAPILDLARRVMVNHAELFGREEFRWVDQEIINYISYSAGNFDTSALLRFIRYGWKDDEYDASRRIGLVHFWPGIEGRPKEERMRDYIETLRLHARGHTRDR